ncbi:hypothetical protein KR009_008697 [Drosophila setifemur]|nr:hypothetical protein KR009_008697 [Drosophila setifemur]
MSGAEKAFELQRQVRQNATVYASSVKDLYSWEKDIKNKEKEMKNAPASAANIVSFHCSLARVPFSCNPLFQNLPVRSHVQKDSPSSSAASTPTEKQDLPIDPVAQQHKKANDIKDRGNSYIKQADYDRAMEAYSEAINVYPYDPIYYINRALCYLKKENFDNCVEDCEAAIALDKLCVKAYYRRMQANESLGNNMEALKDCTTVLTIEPKNIEAKQSLARINERLRKNATKSGPNFTPNRPELIDILPFDKPVYKRSKRPMRRVPIVDIVSPRATSDDAKNLRISDEDIDKIFNSNCGVFEEVKKKDVKQPETKQSPPKVTPVVEAIKDAKKEEKTSPPKAAPVVESSKVQPIASPPKPTKSSSSEGKVAKEVKPNQQKTSEAVVTLKEQEVELKSVERALPPAPTGTAQFHVTWKELTASQKYQYLKSIEIPNLCRILGAGFDSETFTDLLRTVQDFYVPNKEPKTAAVLLEISRNDEFTILAMLMSAEENKMITSILSAIKTWPNQNPDVLEKLKRAYNVA